MDELPPSAHPRPGVVGSRPRLATVFDAPQHHRPILLVLGMHRSGTSLCSNVLSVLGADMADDIGAGRGNDRGHWERWEIVGFHDRILEHLNRRYLGSFHDLPLPAGWWAEPPIVAIRRELTAFLRGRMADGLFGFKDPRTVRLLPLWRQIFAELRLSPRIVLCLRKPAEVARSLYARDGLDPSIGEYRWLIHLTDFFRHIGDSEYCTIEYENWFENTKINAVKLQTFLNLDGEQPGSTLDEALQGIIDPALRHDQGGGRTANEPIVRQFYELGLVAEHDDAARREINKFIAQLDGLGRLQRGFYRAYEAVSATAERIPDLEAEIAALQISVAGDAGSLAQARDEIAAHQARIAALETERQMVEVRATAAEQGLARAQDELAAHQAQVAALETERAHILAESERGKRDHAEALARFDQRAQETAAAEASLRDEIAGLGTQLSEARGRALHAEAATTEAHHTLAQAEACAREKAAEVARARDEVVYLCEQLEAARTVGARLVAAFRTDVAVAPLPMVIRRRWWLAPAALLRFRPGRVNPV